MLIGVGALVVMLVLLLTILLALTRVGMLAVLMPTRMSIVSLTFLLLSVAKGARVLTLMFHRGTSATANVNAEATARTLRSSRRLYI